MYNLLNPPLLEGEYEDSPKDIDPFSELRKELRQFGQLSSQQITDLRKRVERIELFLSSFSRSQSAPVAVSDHKSFIWEEWKEKLKSKPLSAFIDAFLTHGELDANQLAIITKCGRGNVSQYIYRLNKLNLINKNGDRYSLKQL